MITYRGASYELGRGPGFYGVWAAGGPRSRPLERWPETPEGWSAAWTRFAGIEAPGTIVPVGRNTPPVGASALREAEEPGSFGENTASPGLDGHDRGDPGRRGAAAGRPAGSWRRRCSAWGSSWGSPGSFPPTSAPPAWPSNPRADPHAIDLAVWTASAVLILLGGARLRLGALLSLGLSAVTFGLFFAMLGRPSPRWVPGRSGSSALPYRLARLRGRNGGGVPGRPGPSGRYRLSRRARSRGRANLVLGPVILVVLAGLWVAAAFAPAWDSFTLRSAAGQVQTVTAGNAFHNAWPVITGNVAVMVAFAAAVIVAALWRPVRQERCFWPGPRSRWWRRLSRPSIQVRETPVPAQFGIPAGTARQLGITISAGLTPRVLDLRRVPRRADRLVRVDALHAKSRPGDAGRRVRLEAPSRPDDVDGREPGDAAAAEAAPADTAPGAHGAGEHRAGGHQARAGDAAASAGARDGDAPALASTSRGSRGV